MKKFILTGPYEGQTIVLNDRYGFEDGVLECDDKTAELISPILCGFYACKVVDIAEEAEPEISEQEKASLSAAATKPSK